MMEPAPAPAPAPTPAPAPAPAPSSQLVEAQPLREDGLEFLSDTLEREYGDLFIETEEQDDTESVTTLDTAAMVNLRKASFLHHNLADHVEAQRLRAQVNGKCVPKLGYVTNVGYATETRELHAVGVGVGR